MRKHHRWNFLSLGRFLFVDRWISCTNRRRLCLSIVRQCSRLVDDDLLGYLHSWCYDLWTCQSLESDSWTAISSRTEQHLRSTYDRPFLVRWPIALQWQATLLANAHLRKWTAGRVGASENKRSHRTIWAIESDCSAAANGLWSKSSWCYS